MSLTPPRTRKTMFGLEKEYKNRMRKYPHVAQEISEEEEVEEVEEEEVEEEKVEEKRRRKKRNP